MSKAVRSTKSEEKTTYKLTSSKLEGYLEVSFEGGLLKSFEICFKQPLTRFQFSAFQAALPFEISDMGRLENLGLEAQRTAAPNEKIALFCKIYEKHVGIKYKVSASDSGKIKTVQVDDALLGHYFRSENFLWKGKYSIGNLVKYYNELRADMNTGGKPRHPDEWDKAYFAKLKGEQVSEYYRHLKSLGMNAIKNQTGSIIDWK
ncbi:hypothetical protein [Rhodonellum sp.]|uniref:hypothetical protein n=1 Tax=Rhodonellum sp. TaxID=2231180 RepID=UPI00271CFCC1|nr:hypothetical protein [Rhodonellum sp.]MDO9554550.1 hypothetical protein [Rhodonellum sp.]